MFSIFFVTNLVCLSSEFALLRCVAFKPDNANILVIDSNDMTIEVWDITSGSCLSTLRGHSESINSVAFSPDGQFIASCSGEGWNRDNSVRVWNVETGEQLCQLKGHSEDNPECICFGHDEVSDSDDEDSDSDEERPFPRPECPVKAHSDCVRAVAWSPSGQWLASGGGDMMVYVHDAKTFEVKWRLKPEVDNSVESIVYSPDGSKLAAAHWQSVSIFNVETNEVLCTVNVGYAFSRFSTRISLRSRPLFSRFSTKI